MDELSRGRRRLVAAGMVLVAVCVAAMDFAALFALFALLLAVAPGLLGHAGHGEAAGWALAVAVLRLPVMLAMAFLALLRPVRGVPRPGRRWVSKKDRAAARRRRTAFALIDAGWTAAAVWTVLRGQAEGPRLAWAVAIVTFVLCFAATTLSGAFRLVRRLARRTSGRVPAPRRGQAVPAGGDADEVDLAAEDLIAEDHPGSG